MSHTHLQEVLQRFERDDPLALGAGARWHFRRLEERRYSTIYLLTPVGDSSKMQARISSDALVLKIYHAAQPPRRQREFDDLRRAHVAMGPRSGVIEPIVCYADLGAVVTARAPGQSVGPLVRAAVRRSADAPTLARAAVACAEAGAWLRRFQAAGSSEMRGQRSQHLGDARAWIDYLDERLRILCVARPGIEPSLRTRLLAHAAATLQALPPATLEAVTWSHGDFGPHNLLFEGDAVTVLDLELAPQHPAFDAAYFVEALALHAGPFVDPTRVLRLERAFLAGAGASGEESLFRLFRLRHLLCAYVSETRRRGVATWRQLPGLFALRARLRRFPHALPLRPVRRAA